MTTKPNPGSLCFIFDFLLRKIMMEALHTIYQKKKKIYGPRSQENSSSKQRRRGLVQSSSDMNKNPHFAMLHH